MSRYLILCIFSIFVLNTFLRFASFADILEDEAETGRYVIEGRVFPAEGQEHLNWQVHTRIHVNGGKHIGFIRSNGSFVLNNLPSGSYIVEAIHPDYMYEPVRVEINSKGKYRARLVDLIQTAQIIKVPYPLRMKMLSKLRYFQVREQWGLSDFLFDHMVIMMVLPLLIILILPKMMPPETKDDLKQISEITNITDMPDMSEMFTNLFSGAVGKVPSSKAKKSNKRTNVICDQIM